MSDGGLLLREMLLLVGITDIGYQVKLFHDEQFLRLIEILSLKSVEVRSAW